MKAGLVGWGRESGVAGLRGRAPPRAPTAHAPPRRSLDSSWPNTQNRAARTVMLVVVEQTSARRKKRTLKTANCQLPTHVQPSPISYWTTDVQTNDLTCRRIRGERKGPAYRRASVCKMKSCSLTTRHHTQPAVLSCTRQSNSINGFPHLSPRLPTWRPANASSTQLAQG